MTHHDHMQALRLLSEQDDRMRRKPTINKLLSSAAFDPVVVELAMHLCFRTLPGVKLCAQSCQSIKSSGRRGCSGSPFKRSLLAFAEREAQEQPWSANSAGQKYAA